MTNAYCQVCGHNRPHRVRTIEVRNIGGVNEILLLAAKVLGRKKIHRSTLVAWRDQAQPPFPKPIKKVSRQSVELFDLAEVRAWLEAPRYVGNARPKEETDGR